MWGSLPVDQPCINLQIIMKFRESLLIIHMFPHKKDCYTVSSEPTQAATGPGDWTVVDTYLSFQDCLQSTPRYTEQLGITIIANVSMLLLGSMTWEQWKKAKNTNPANQDKQTGKGSTNKFCQITALIVITTVNTDTDQWLQFGFFLVAENAQLAGGRVLYWLCSDCTETSH